MPGPRDLERRVEELERQVALLGHARYRSTRYQSSLAIGDIPLLCVATGPDAAKGEIRGHAKGVIAIGDIATGVVAIGGLARGIVAIGGLALGAITLGGLSIGAFIAVGGLGIGSYAFGGGALGMTAIGGGAAGVYACGGGAVGEHVISPTRRDAEAVEYFKELGLESFCDPRRARRN